jgi:hypothetical protein
MMAVHAIMKELTAEIENVGHRLFMNNLSFLELYNDLLSNGARCSIVG